MVFVLIHIAVVMWPVLSQSRKVGHIVCMRFLVTNSNSTHYYCLSWILGLLSKGIPQRQSCHIICLCLYLQFTFIGGKLHHL